MRPRRKRRRCGVPDQDRRSVGAGQATCRAASGRIHTSRRRAAPPGMAFPAPGFWCSIPRSEGHGMRAIWTTTGTILATLALAACGPSDSTGPGPDDDDDDAAGPHLRLAPGAVTLAIEDGVPAEQVYTVFAVADDGSE